MLCLNTYLDLTSALRFKDPVRLWLKIFINNRLICESRHLASYVSCHNAVAYDRFWVICVVKMMPLRHGWGLQPPQPASGILIRHIQSVWAYWTAILGHMAWALNSFTHTTWVRFWSSGSLVESKWCRYVIFEAYCHLKLLPTSTLYIYNVIEHIDMLFLGTWQ